MNEISFTFDADKNALLKKTRDISFEDIIYAIQNNKVLDILPNTNDQYLGQYILIVEIDDYIYQAPFRYIENDIHLITVFPSRKATKKYLEDKK